MSSSPSNAFFVALVLALLLPTGSAQAQSSPAPRLVSLDEARQLAMEQNPELAIIDIELRRAELLVEREETARVPLFTAESGYRYGLSPFFSPSGTSLIDSSALTFGARLFHTFAPGTQLGVTANLGRAARDSVELGELGIAWDSSLGVDITQPILRGFGREITDANLRSAQVSLDTARLQQRSNASAILLDVLTRYWNLWLAQQSLHIQQEALAIAEQNLDNARVRKEAGTLSNADVISLRAEVSSARERLLAARSRLRQESTALTQLLGLPPAETLRASEDSLPALPDIDLDAALHSFRQNSPDYQRQRTAIRAAELQAELARDNARIRLDATGSFRVDGLDRSPSDALAQLGRLEGWIAFAGLRLEMPVNQRSRQTELERSELAIAAAQAELQRLESTETARIQNLLDNITFARAQADLARETAEFARENADAQSARYELGRATTFEVIDAAYRLQEAELRVLELEASIVQQLLSLQHLTGQLL